MENHFFRGAQKEAQGGSPTAIRLHENMITLSHFFNLALDNARDNAIVLP